MMKSCWAKCWRSICAYPLCGKFQEDDDGSLNEGQNWTISHQAQETVVFERLPPILETISLPPLTYVTTLNNRPPTAGKISIPTSES